MVITSTGAVKAVSKALPELDGKDKENWGEMNQKQK
jgi:hypothetical protein